MSAHSRGGPPRLLGFLLRRVVPGDTREGIAGDMEETYRSVRGERGLVHAVTWYSVQIVSLLVRFLPERVGDLWRGPGWVSWLDLKLGCRMLVKHPGLNLASGTALAVTIAFGAGLYEFFGEFLAIELPFADGDRVVRVTNWDAEERSSEPRSGADYYSWRAGLNSMDHVAAVAPSRANMAAIGGLPDPVRGARVTASMFDIAGVPPAIGRPLLSMDETPGGAPVVVVAHEVWEAQLGGAPLGDRFLTIDGVTHEVVGVMPPAFRFPLDEQWWAPLRLAETEVAPRAGPLLAFYGRLADGATLESAQAELSTIGLRNAERWPETHGRLVPRVTGFGSSPGQDWQRWVALGVQAGFAMLVVLAALNVAILSFSRTASRQGEIAVRTALGAGRRRIMGQLFLEALVLCGISAALGLTVAAVVVPVASELFWQAQGMDVPYWVKPGLSPGTGVYALGLAVLGAFVAGSVPAARVTGKGVADGLRSVSLGGSPLRFGFLPTAVIVAQVALSVAFMPFPVAQGVTQWQGQPGTDALPGERILTAQLQVNDSEVPGSSLDSVGVAELEMRVGERLTELADRLVADPEVVAVAFADRIPGEPHRRGRVRLEGDSEPPDETKDVRVASVVPGYVEGLGARLVSGRPFRPGDVASSAPRVAVVNAAFVSRFLGSANAVGQRLQVALPGGEFQGPWFEVVGVLENLIVSPDGQGIEGAVPGAVPAVYTPAEPGALNRVKIAVRTEGPALAIAPVLRQVAVEVDPRMRVDDILALDRLVEREGASLRLLAGLSLLLAFLVVGLAVGGVYTLMSFVVEQRTREIGVRTALGASTKTLLWGMFARTLKQISFGVALGLLLLVGLYRPADRSVVAVALFSTVLVVAAGLIACAVPSVRAIRIQPVEALRSD